MNRQQRRKGNREKSKSDKVLNLKKSDLLKIRQEVEKDAINQALALCLNVVALNLHDKLGFGSKRTTKFLLELLNQFECIGDQYIDFNDTRKIIKDEMGIVIESTDKKITVITK